MHKRFLLVLTLIMVVGITCVSCAPTSQPPKEYQKCAITLNAVELMNFIPFEKRPVSGIASLNIVFKVDNPNDYTIKLEDLECVIWIATTGYGRDEYDIGASRLLEPLYVPPQGTNYLRLPVFVDTEGLFRSMAVSYLEPRPVDLLTEFLGKDGKIADLKANYRVSGIAIFKSQGGTQELSLNLRFP